MISQSRYVKIVSGVGGGATVATRQLILRMITTNSKIAPNEIREFGSADSVLEVFGVSSEEYQRAVRYFGFISKSVRAPSRMSFVRWVNQAIPPSVKGTAVAIPLSIITAVSAGTLRFIFDGGTPIDVTGINLTTATDMTHVATLVTAQIQQQADPNLQTSNVVYDTSTKQFIWTGGVATNVTVEIPVIGGSNDVGSLLNLSDEDAIVTAGQNREDLSTCASRTTAEDNNFGTLVVTRSIPVAIADLAGLSAWNKAQNNMYIVSTALSLAQIRDAASFDQFIGMSGTGINCEGSDEDDYIDQAPAEILAATDYDSPNATQNYMYYEFPTRSVAVSTDTLADELDAKSVNYIGVTQTAGQKFAFYQRGVLQGGPNDAIDMNIYANEMWLKDYISSQYMTAFRALPIISADDDGRNTLVTVMQGCVDKAKLNGTIAVGKPLTTIQQLYIGQITGDRLAWHQVATLGFWFNVDFLSRTGLNGKTEWYAKYILVYAKDDAIRAVEGQDVLI